MLTALPRAKHPNSARLFANFIMSEAGNKIYNADPGALSIYDTSNLPGQYESPKTTTVGRKAQILRLLGLGT